MPHIKIDKPLVVYKFGEGYDAHKVSCIWKNLSVYMLKKQDFNVV